MNKANLKEYLGLHKDTKTWEYITEEEYQNLKSITGTALPSMAISKIKLDENGAPVRAKYRIVVWGNLDPHNTACFTPVLSALELRLMVGLATENIRVLKSGQVSQAFIQSVLPYDEKYIIKPLKTLYGLRRSPCHQFNTYKAALESLGLHSMPNAPRIFSGTSLEGHPPLYLALFVDDFCYF